jgi:NAD(P)-dependent dehydrogenase (short-subunit alcohol dehydrogenase family)
VAGNDLTIITGGSRGIGHHLVQSCLEDMDVLNISRQPATIDHGAARHDLHNLSLDLQDVERIAPALSTWFHQHPDYRVKLLISNAAILNLGWLDKVSPGEIRQAFDVNVLAPLAITTLVLEGRYFAQTGGRVVYVTSSLARPEPALSFAGLGLYSVTKAALSRLALIQRRELELTAPQIEVLRVHPGVVDTEIQDELRHNAALDPAFSEKTAGLPRYEEGDWDDKLPAEHMRTISSDFAAEFILWAAKRPKVSSEEYDFYKTLEFHAARSRS